MNGVRKLACGFVLAFAAFAAASAFAGPESPYGSGGEVTFVGANKDAVHTFTSVGDNSFTLFSEKEVWFLVVGGGGAGGRDCAGGGGGGGFVESNSVVLAAGNYTITVGAGGQPTSTRGGNGGDSVVSIGGVDVARAVGGGGGAGWDVSSGVNGGSGGGATRNNGTPGVGVPGQGNDGGYTTTYARPNGGGGAGASGGIATGGKNAGKSGDGGAGLASSISGVSTYYAGGGGGGGYNDNPGTGGLGGGGNGAANNSVANRRAIIADPETGKTQYEAECGVNGLGGGGGGGNNTDHAGLPGGSGIVIIRIAGDLNSQLEISSEPEGVGSPSPEYGGLAGLSAGDARAVSCGATFVTNETGTVAYLCTGWKLYDKDDNVVSNGTDTSFTYIHPTPAAFRKLEWQWRKSVAGTILAGDFGSVSPSGTAWYYCDTPVTATATPNSGIGFAHWTGTLPAGIDATLTSVTFTPTEPFAMTARFGAAHYEQSYVGDGNILYTFFASGPVVIDQKVKARLLLVGGGGAGGRECSGGGGAGGMIDTNDIVFAAGTYMITVGAGGQPANGRGGNGGNSVISLNDTPLFTAIGGGGGGGYGKGIRDGVAGGCGGGGANIGVGGAGTEGQGYAGGSAMVTDSIGGGGGAGGPGVDGTVSTKTGIPGSAGGPGRISDITGVEVYYAGGGGGGGFDYGGIILNGGIGGGGNGARNVTVAARQANTLPDGRNEYEAECGVDGLGGGGGGANNISADYQGRPGGRGVVIIRTPGQPDSALQISGTPDYIGAPDPDYGHVTSLVAGSMVPVSCGVATVTNETETIVYSCTGWKLYDKNGNVLSNGTDTAFTYVHPTPAAFRMLEWQWSASKVKVATSAGEHGSVSPSGNTWVATDTAVSVTATPDAGYEFVRWTGTILNGVDVWSPSVSFVPSAPVDMTAVFAKPLFVATTGNDANPGTQAEPFATISNAIVQAKAVIDGGMSYVTIHVAAGTYAETDFALDAPIMVVGDTGNPKDVTIETPRGSNNKYVTGKRIFTISHPDAVVRSLTLTGQGLYTSYNVGTASYGGHVNMSDGLVENCVISSGYAGGGSTGGWGRGYGGNVYITGGRLSRSVIVGGHAAAFKQSSDADNRRSYGGGVYAGGTALVDSCLIYNNGNDTLTYGGGICADGSATVANCTIVGNTTAATAPGAGVCVYSASARVVNCVMFGNGGTEEREFGTANLGQFEYCASSIANTSCATWRLIDATAFANYHAQDFRNTPASPLTDGGTAVVPYSSGAKLDIVGNPRLSGAASDIGACEINQAAAVCVGYPASYGVFAGTNTSFIASAVGGSGTYLFRWDFGNGVTATTSEGTYAYAYPAAGLFTVKVAVSDDGGSTWSAWSELAEKVVVVPDTMYMDSANANPEYPYDTPSKAARTIADCLLAMTNNFSANLAYVDGATIRVLSGTHPETGLELAAAVTICGDTGDPKDVTITTPKSGTKYVTGKRIFTISHPGAVVKDLTLSGPGWNVSDFNGKAVYGGHVYMTDGLVENCVISGGYAAGGSAGGWGRGYGGNVYITGGRLYRSVITEGHAVNVKQTSDIDTRRSYGGGVYAGGAALVDSCLIYNNGNDMLTYGGGVCADGSATVANCTIIGNTTADTAPGAGICVYSASAKVVNCVMFGNGGTEKREFGTGNLDRFAGCASSITNSSCATWRLIDDTAFVGYSAQDFHATAASALVNGGTTDPAWYPNNAGDCDLDGNQRVSGSEIDIGCYELDQSSVSVSGLSSTYATFVGSNITFTASAIGGSGTYLFRWRFGNGMTATTGLESFDYAYPTSGLYTLSIEASDNGGATWSTPVVLPTKIVVVPPVMYADSANANPEYPFDTPDKAAAKIADCLAAMTNNVSANLACVDGAVVRVLAGTHAETGLELAAAVTVCGDTGNPADVTIVDSVNESRAFTIRHAGAVVKDLTISGTGWRTTYYAGPASYGGHVHMTAGLVENCVISGGYAGGGSNGGWGRGYGGNVYMTGGRLSRSVITNGHCATFCVGTFDDGHRSYGGGVCADGNAVVENCFICGNDGVAWTYGGGVCAMGNSVVLNCTIVNNPANVTVTGANEPVAGVCVWSASAGVTNCVIFGNGGTAEQEIGTANLGRYGYCASSVTNASCATWRLIDSSVFVNSAGGGLEGFSPDMRVKRNPLIDTGSSFAEYQAIGPVSTSDFAGNERMTNHAMDLGCFEARWLGSVLRFR